MPKIPACGRSSGSYPNSGFSDSVSGFCKIFLKLKKSNGFSDSRILLHFLKANYLNGFSDSVSGFSYSTDSRILNGFSVADSQKLLKLDFSSIYVIIYLKTQITLVLEGFRTNPEKYELFEFDFFFDQKFFFWKFKKFP